MFGSKVHLRSCYQVPGLMAVHSGGLVAANPSTQHFRVSRECYWHTSVPVTRVAECLCVQGWVWRHPLATSSGDFLREHQPPGHLRTVCRVAADLQRLLRQHRPAVSRYTAKMQTSTALAHTQVDLGQQQQQQLPQGDQEHQLQQQEQPVSTQQEVQQHTQPKQDLPDNSPQRAAAGFSGPRHQHSLHCSSPSPRDAQQAAAVPPAVSSAAADALPVSVNHTNDGSQGPTSSIAGGENSVVQQQQQRQQRQRQQGHKSSNDQQKQDKPRPTHFVSLRVSHSPQVVSCIEGVQQQLLSVRPELQPCLLEPVTAHTTLMVLNINSQEQDDVASAVMSSLPSVLQQQGLGQLMVTLRGLSTFRNQVLYLDFAQGPTLDQLYQLSHSIISHFRSQGSEIVINEPGRDFTPHVTVAKTSRLLGGRHHHDHHKKRGKGRVKIPPEAWADCSDVCAGEVLLAELQICSMQGRKTGEFYKVTHSIPLPAVPTPPTAPAAVGAAAHEPTAQAPTAQVPAAQERKRAASGPVSGAKRRFKHLLEVLTCRRRAELGGVDADSNR